MAPLFGFQNSHTINGCLHDTYQLGATILNDPAKAYDKAGPYVSHVYEKGKNYFTGEQVANDLEKAYSDASHYLLSLGSVSAWQQTIDVWTDVASWKSTGHRAATWGASWLSPKAWGKWVDAVFVKKTEK